MDDLKIKINRLSPAAQREYMAIERMVEKHNAARLHLLAIKDGIDARLQDMNKDAVEIYSCWQQDNDLVQAFDCRIQFDGTLKFVPWPEIDPEIAAMMEKLG